MYTKCVRINLVDCTFWWRGAKCTKSMHHCTDGSSNFFFSVPGPEVGPGQYTGPAEEAESIEGGNRDPPPYSSLFPEIQVDKK